MSCPAKIEQVIKQFKKATTELTNDQIIMMAGGTDGQWGSYLKGPRVQAIVRAANIELAMENFEIVARGGRRWRMVTCAEARVTQAHQQTRKASNHLDNAEDNMLAVARDERAPRRLREDAQAWLTLYRDEHGERNLTVFQEWADELVKQLPAPSGVSEG